MVLKTMTRTPVMITYNADDVAITVYIKHGLKITSLLIAMPCMLAPFLDEAREFHTGCPPKKCLDDVTARKEQKRTIVVTIEEILTIAIVLR